jgi:amidase
VLIEWVLRETTELAVDVGAVEMDEALQSELSETLADCVASSADRITVRQVQADFVDFAIDNVELRFDLVIHNPPHKKLPTASDANHKLVAHGIEVPNIYAAFLALGARLLDNGGQLVSITPHSFMNGAYCGRFRIDLLNHVAINALFTFHSRSKVLATPKLSSILLPTIRVNSSAALCRTPMLLPASSFTFLPLTEPSRVSCRQQNSGRKPGTVQLCQYSLMTASTPSEITDLSATEMARLIRGGTLSARDAVQAHFDQIDLVNPSINAIILQDREGALRQARSADEMTVSGADLPLLHGVPITHKDTNNTKGMRTTQGSVVLKDYVPLEDDLVVARFKRGGVISTGKSNVPEFAAGAHTFNDLFGTTTNPFDPTLSAGGSSGGVAAALAARIQNVGDGSDIGGSLRIPASFCNVVGLRPSRGRIPVIGPNSWSWLGRTGPMAREVTDIALAMSVLAGPDPRAPLSIPEDGRLFSQPLERDIRGLRIGWSRDFGLGVPVEPEVIAVLERAMAVFEHLGAIVEEAEPELSDADEVFSTTRAFDFSMLLSDFVEQHRDFVKPELQWNVEIGASLTAADLASVALARTRLERKMATFHERFDVFASPVAQLLPFDAVQRFPTSINDIQFDNYLGWLRSVTLMSAADVPAISVPAGFSETGLPIGLQLTMPHGKDFELLQVAFAFEQSTQYARVKPPVLTSRSSADEGRRFQESTTVRAASA